MLGYNKIGAPENAGPCSPTKDSHIASSLYASAKEATFSSCSN